MTTSIKTCFKCNKEKALTDFYKHKQMADGHLNKCKDCACRDARKRRFDPEKRAKVLEYDRKRGSRQPPFYAKEYREKNAEKYAAHTAVGNALRDGKLEKPNKCSHCYSVGVVEGHHHDYARPLQVVWLCPPCHRQLHAMLRTVEQNAGKWE